MVDAPVPAAAAAPWWRTRVKTLVGVAFLVLVLGLAVLVVLRDREQFSAAVARIGWGPAVLSGLFGAGAVAVGRPVWTESLGALGARLPGPRATQVFFVSQLGKYLPGSVWPALAQMEAGRSAGVARRTMLSANLLSLVVGLATGSTLACVLLPLASPEALRRFWWLLLALPFLLSLLHPRVLPWLLDRAFRVLRRPPLEQRLAAAPLARAAGWSLLGWVFFGAHLATLVAAFGASAWSLLVLSVGAMSLAVSVGILFIPAPAGAGLREVALLLALSPVLDPGQALAVAVVSRIVLVAVDVALAGVAALVGPVLGRRTGARAPETTPAPR